MEPSKRPLRALVSRLHRFLRIAHAVGGNRPPHGRSAIPSKDRLGSCSSVAFRPWFRLATLATSDGSCAQSAWLAEPFLAKRSLAVKPGSRRQRSDSSAEGSVVAHDCRTSTWLRRGTQQPAAADQGRGRREPRVRRHTGHARVPATTRRTAQRWAALKSTARYSAVAGPRAHAVPGFRSIQEVGPVQGVALLGDKPRFADHPPQVLFRGRVARAGLADDVLL